MKARKGLIAAAVLGLFVLMLGGEAQAERIELQPALQVMATLPKSNGYELKLVSGGKGEVLLYAQRGKGLSAVYAAPGTAGRQGISADFGEFGQVELRWTKQKIEQRKPGKYCEGQPTTIGRGIFHGTIELRGQEGFVEAHLEQARGGFRQYRREVCHLPNDRYAREYARPQHGGGGQPQGGDELFATNVLQATSETAGRTVELIASQPGLPGLEFFDATATELVGQVQIRTAAHAFGEGESLSFSDERPPRTASLTPPPPFDGSASFKSQHGSTTWTGDLATPLPGMGIVPLTGDAFVTKTCRRDLASGFEGCGPGRSERSRPQGSGSHSHPFAEARLSSLR